MAFAVFRYMFLQKIDNFPIRGYLIIIKDSHKKPICFFFIGYPSLNNQDSLLVCQQSRMIQYQQSSVCYIAKLPSPAPPVYLQLPATIASHSFKCLFDVVCTAYSLLIYRIINNINLFF